jgi:hypothetical protein
MALSMGAITVDYSAEVVSILTALKDLTGGIGRWGSRLIRPGFREFTTK